MIPRACPLTTTTSSISRRGNSRTLPPVPELAMSALYAPISNCWPVWPRA